MKKSALGLVTLLTFSAAQALTFQGSVTGADLPASSRVSLWTLSEAGAPLGELVSAPVQERRFSLSLPEAAPASRAQTALRPRSIGWPGVIGEVKVNAAVQSSSLGWFVYDDANRNGHRDDNEALIDAVPEVQRRPLVTVWSSSDVLVSAGRGFSAALKSGWNTFLVELGRATTVSAYQGQVLSLRVQR